MAALFNLGPKTVGREIRESDITEFYYTLSGSTYPPHYQRYRFYIENGQLWFYHEKREGNRWPLQEEDITVSGKKALSDGEKKTWYQCLEGGTVKAREVDTSSGGAGPWLYLYWKGDGGVVQQFTFASLEKQRTFETFCAGLAKGAGQAFLERGRRIIENNK